MKDKLKFLIIDDETLIRKSLELACQQRGHETYSSETGKKGIEIWKKEQPDIVFLDILLSDMQGFDVLKEMGSDHGAQVVLISAHDDLNLNKVSVALKIKKPFPDIFQLIKQAEELTNKS